MSESWKTGAQREIDEIGPETSDHAMAASFGQSRSLRQSSRVGCKDEYHDKRVAAAVARQIARENPMMMVQYDGNEIKTDQLTDARMISKSNDPRIERQMKLQAEAELRRIEREETIAAEKKREADAAEEKRRAEALERKKRHDEGLKVRLQADQEAARKRRERLGLPVTATAGECNKAENALKKRERDEERRRVQGEAARSAYPSAAVVPPPPPPDEDMRSSKKAKVSASEFGPKSSSSKGEREVKSKVPKAPKVEEVKRKVTVENVGSAAGNIRIENINPPPPPPPHVSQREKAKPAEKPKDTASLLSSLTQSWGVSAGAKPQASASRRTFTEGPQKTKLPVEMQQILEQAKQRRSKEGSSRRSKWA